MEVRINGERINGLFHPLTHVIYWGYNGYNPLILTINPDFHPREVPSHRVATLEICEKSSQDAKGALVPIVVMNSFLYKIQKSKETHIKK